MLRLLLDEKILTCPACRGIHDGVFRDHPLFLLEVLAEQDGRVLHGFLGCHGCPTRYPVIDGVAVVFKDVADWLRQQERPTFWRDDLPHGLQSWLLAAWPDDQDPNWRRQMLAIYGSAFAPDPQEDGFGGSLLAEAARSRAFLEERRATLLAAAGPSPLVLDVGCAVGASSLDLAARGAWVLAMDTDLGALQVLAKLARTGRAEVPAWRHAGFDYVPRTLEATPTERVLPIAADALDPPLRAHTMRLATAYNVLDNVRDPVLLLRQLNAALAPGGTLVASSPYDWVSRCTPRQERLGESIRVSAAQEPDPAQALRDLLEGRLPALAPELALSITYELDALPWLLRRHRRSWHVFLTHYVEATAPPSS